jgi:hypothetical protein
MTENGKCITMTGAYRESLLPEKPKDDKKQKAREARYVIPEGQRLTTRTPSTGSSQAFSKSPKHR